MSKIKMGAKVYEAKWVECGQELMDGVARPILTVQLAADAEKLDALNTFLGDSKNTGTITVENSETGVAGSVASQILEGYTIKKKVAIEPFPAGFDENGDMQVEDRIVFVLARRTLQEQQNEKILAALAKLGGTL